MWALQIVLTAPYPLVEIDEMFVTTGPEGAGASRLTAMRRNECAVTIENRRRKLLLVSSACEASIHMAGIVAALDRILRTPTPLKVVTDQWLATRMTATNVDWAVIDEIGAWLMMRFIPQPEVYHDVARESETHWLPPAYRDITYATHTLPVCITTADESEFYYHDHATTFNDNVFVDRATANRVPALRVGAWTNEAELITGLEIATYAHVRGEH
ncbi:unnamed protein product [Arctia plantaginis]|uniref:Uncharacterized protein n=1 Tax=Arctia plantaginis TaxID=874455 RepID=A0A8S0ZIT5_ARCPL|nr:unnamed protein product [Arctia plantaginis]